jgi:8-oxo-dGTP diphosphatase
MERERPRVGVAVIVQKEGQVLLGQRLGAHGAGSWQFPGGHLEYGESLELCAAREVMEETGLVVRGIRPVTFTNDIFAAEGKHYVTLYMLADYDGGTPEVREPHKCVCWEWFSWDALPRPLFLPIENLLRAGFGLDGFLAEG